MAKKNDDKKRSVVTFPLVTEKWQEDLLDKRFEICRKIYNNMLSYVKKQLNKAMTDPRYVEAKTTINSVYKIKDEDERKKAWKSKEVKAAQKQQSDILKKYGITRYGLGSLLNSAPKKDDDTDDRADKEKQIPNFRVTFSQNIATNLADLSIAEPMWSAVDKYLSGKGRTIHFKSYGSLNSVVTNGKSGIRLVGEDGKSTLHGITDGSKAWILFSGGTVTDTQKAMGLKTGKVMKMPVKIDTKDKYKMAMFDRNFVQIRITRKFCGTKYHYFVQFVMDGAPVTIYDKDKKVKHPIGSGSIGVYVDTTSVTVAKQDGAVIALDVHHNDKTQQKIADINRAIEESRRATNPDNYDEKGRIKNGIIINGKRRKLRWTFSNRYKKLKAQRRNLYRIEKENRILERNILANEILSYGDDIIFNDYPFQAAAELKVRVADGPKDEVKEIKTAGAAIGNNSPGLLVDLVDRKLKARRGKNITKIQLENIDYKSDDYRKDCAIRLLNGDK